MRYWKRAVLLLAVVLSLCRSVPAWEDCSSTYLYTKTDPSAGGGIKGEIAGTGQPLIGVFALPPHEPRFVYRGTVRGGGREFVFSGLPVAKYDLILLFEDMIYEGLNLNRGENTLTSKDKQLIKEIIDKSERFFNKKIIYRMAGTTGKLTGTARCICTFRRTAKSSYDSYVHPNVIHPNVRRDSADHKRQSNSGQSSQKGQHRHSYKLVLLQDVGPGWQVERTREIALGWITGTVYPEHAHRKYLSGIRVTDSVKDLGKINLTKADR